MPDLIRHPEPQTNLLKLWMPDQVRHDGEEGRELPNGETYPAASPASSPGVRICGNSRASLPGAYQR
jgi:hypothetical protein